MERRYIHYGSKEFDITKYEPIKNEEVWIKPYGGLWGSPVNSERDFKMFCESTFANNRRDNTKIGEYLSKSFLFTVKDTANIHYIHDMNTLLELPTIDYYKVSRLSVYIDFEKALSMGIDAIEYKYPTNQSILNPYYNALYGWDCDSILVMNPDIIQI